MSRVVAEMGPGDRLPLVSIGVVSAAALADQVLLTRFFSVVHWHHFAYMMISLALLGFGASGTFLALARRWLLQHFTAAFIVNLLLFGVFAIVAPLVAAALPFRAEELLWNPWQPLWLATTYLALAIPFFCAANAIGLVLVARRARAGRIYAADLAGGGIGSLLILGALYFLAPEHALKLVGGAGCLAATIASVELQTRSPGWRAAGILGVVLIAAIPGTWLRPQPGPYKSLSQALRVGGVRIVAETSSPLGRVTVIESPRVPLRHAPGLSLASAGEPPPQLGLFTDGDDMDAITAASDDSRRLSWLGETPSALAYAMAKPRSVLVLGAGGGLEILRARELGAEHIEAVELNSQVARLLSSDFADYTGRLLDQAGVELHVGDTRGFLAAHAGRFELLQMPLAGSAGGGLSGLNEDYLHTVEAVQLYLTRLEPQGFVSMTSYVQLPPRDALKLFATAIAALRSSGVTEPGNRLLMIRGWQTATLLVKNGEVTDADIARLRDFCDRYSFDAAWFPGMQRAEANRYNELPEPWFFDGARALLGADSGRFIATYPFDIRPATDDRPYFQNFFRWTSFVAAWRAKGRGGMALLEAGYAVLAATVVQAVLAGIVLVVVPLLAIREKGPARNARWRVAIYFTGIGLAFLFIEIVFLHKLLLVVHHPTIALAVVLATFLIAAGAGSAWTARARGADQGRRRLGMAVLGIVLLGALYSLGFDSLLALLDGWSLPARAGAGAVLLAPLAFLMGTPFPLALRELEEPLAPWAWGINGCASVVSPALAVVLAIDLGFTVVLWLALALYLLVFTVFPRAARVM